MANTKDIVQIGPFSGGLNTFSDPTAVDDNELVVCENFELDLDGSLVSRPPVVYKGVQLPLGTTGNAQLLGYYYDSSGAAYLIASDGLNTTYYYNGTSWSVLTSTFAASAMTQFNGVAWMTAPVGSVNPGGYWSPTVGFVPDANMPKGEVIAALKTRLWVAAGKDATSNGTRLYFSKVLGQTPFWQVAPDFIDIGAGDGQNIVQVVVYYNSLLIFRTNSIYSFQYTSDPAAGTVSLVVPGVGLSNKDSVVPYESYLYFMYNDKAYEFLNSRANQINVKVPFRSTSRLGLYASYSVSRFNKRILFNYWDTTYVYSLRTRTWTTWRSTVNGPLGKIVELSQNTVNPQAILFSSSAVAIGGSRTAKMLSVEDGLTTDAETMQCVVQTKNYNYQAASIYKKLAWWGLDAVFKGNVTALATPITYNYTVTWGQLRSQWPTNGWAYLRNFTWGQPISGTLSVQTIRDTTGAGSMRKFVKFMQALRFRQIYFRATFDTDGSVNTAPVRLFQFITYVRPKEKVSKTIT